MTLFLYSSSLTLANEFLHIAGDDGVVITVS